VNVRTSRKSFLRGMGAAAITGPFLRLLERGAEAAPPRRLVIFVTPNGTVMNSFWPAAGCVYGPILKPLEPLKSKILVMRGINMNTAYKDPIPRDHLPDYANALTGRQPTGGSFSNNRIEGISIDQHIANTVGKMTKFASLQLGVKSGAGAYPLLASGPGQVISPENSPQKIFDRLFTNFTPPNTTGMPMSAGTIDPALDRLRADRASMLDLVRQELADVRCQLGAADRPKFDAHVDALRELEKNLSFTPTGGSGGGPTGGTVGAGCQKPASPGAPADFPTLGVAQTKNLVAALACDLTRVAVLQWSTGASGVSHDWANAPGSHHGISHGSEGVTASPEQRQQWLVNIETWYAGRMYDLCKALNDIPDGTGTLLDNTSVLWIHEQSNGGSHLRKDMPYVLAGAMGGAFRVGRCVQFNGVSHNNLLISLAEGMGVPTASFGDPDFSTGPLAELR
jgi:hypothetical protein